jgi:ribosomal protein S18 acetylase RimI-like enzyme
VSDHPDIVVLRRPGDGPLVARFADMLAAYHLQTQAEKGEGVADVDGLPHRYRAEIRDPQAAFASDVVLLALSGDTAVGCLILTDPVDGRSEVRRLWTDPASRNRGVAAAMVRAALARSAQRGDVAVRLSVWRWRTGAVALYERLGFAVVESWDERDQLVCMEARRSRCSVSSSPT